MNGPVLEIVRPGPLATVQDLGRTGFQHMGVPVCGAMDSWALRLGNVLVGNPPGEAGIEITLGGFEGLFLRETWFALTGSNDDSTLDGAAISAWRAVHARPGDRLRLRGATGGARDYLCLAGGVSVPLVLGSKATYLPGGFGGLYGRALRAGDVIRAGPAGGRIREAIPDKLRLRYGREMRLRIIPGPQEESLTRESWDLLLSGTFEVTDRCDRMGCLLKGPVLGHRHGPDIVSDGIALGAVQVPGSGQPFILLADRPTTGGYAKPAVVGSFDVPLIAQALPWWVVHFERISVWEARKIHLMREYALRRFVELE